MTDNPNSPRRGPSFPVTPKPLPTPERRDPPRRPEPPPPKKLPETQDPGKLPTMTDLVSRGITAGGVAKSDVEPILAAANPKPAPGPSTPKPSPSPRPVPPGPKIIPDGMPPPKRPLNG